MVTLGILDFKTKDHNGKAKHNNKSLYILEYSLVTKPKFSSFQIHISQKNRLTPSFTTLWEPRIRRSALDHAWNWDGQASSFSSFPNDLTAQWGCFLLQPASFLPAPPPPCLCSVSLLQDWFACTHFMQNLWMNLLCPFFNFLIIKAKHGHDIKLEIRPCHESNFKLKIMHENCI